MLSSTMLYLEIWWLTINVPCCLSISDFGKQSPVPYGNIISSSYFFACLLLPSACQCSLLPQHFSFYTALSCLGTPTNRCLSLHNRHRSWIFHMLSSCRQSCVLFISMPAHKASWMPCQSFVAQLFALFLVSHA